MNTSSPTQARSSLAIISALLPLAMAMSSAFGQTAPAGDSSAPVTVQPTDTAVPPAQADWRARPTLTGDWRGMRPSLADKGVIFDLRYTSTYQGLASGTGARDYEYGGKVDAFVNLDSGKMGLWEGGGFRSHFEYRHGEAPANLGGAIFAVNTALYWPVDTPNEVVATSLYFTQKLGDRGSVAIGKFNPVDLLAADPFYGGWGIDRFMNLIFAAPPSGLIPVVFMGAVGTLKTDPVAWTLMVFDPKDRTNDYLPGDLFKTGVNVSLSGAHTTTLAGRKTTYVVTGHLQHGRGVDYLVAAARLRDDDQEGLLQPLIRVQAQPPGKPGRSRTRTGASTSRRPPPTATPTTCSHR